MAAMVVGSGRVRLARGVCCCDVDFASLRVALGHICVGFTACIEYVFLCQCGVCECWWLHGDGVVVAVLACVGVPAYMS